MCLLLKLLWTFIRSQRRFQCSSTKWCQQTLTVWLYDWEARCFLTMKQSRRASSPVGELLSTFAFCGCLTEHMKLGDMLQHPVTFDISLNINKTRPQLRSMKKLKAHLSRGFVTGQSQLNAADIGFLNACSNVKDQTSDLLGENLSTWAKPGLVGNEAKRERMNLCAIERIWIKRCSSLDKISSQFKTRSRCLTAQTWKFALFLNCLNETEV